MTAPDGTTTSLPRNDFCWPCAVALECWPRQDKEVSFEQYQRDPGFKAEVQHVRQGVLRCRAQLELERVVVEKRTEVCTRMIRRYHFVYAVPFSKYFGVPLDTITDMCVQMRTPDYEYCEGVLIRGAVPEDLEHDLVEVSSSMSRAKIDELASQETCLRNGQASERFERAAAAQIANRPVGMKVGPNARRPLTFSELRAKVEAEDARRQELEAQAAAGGCVSGSQHVSASRLDDDDDAPPAGGASRKGPAARPPASRKGPAAGPRQIAAAKAAVGAAKSPVARHSSRWATLARDRGRLPVAPVPVFGGSVTPSFVAAATPGLAAPCTPAFRLTPGPGSSAAPAGGVEADVIMSCDAGSEVADDEPATIHDMMNLSKVLVEQESVDKRKLRKASLG